MDLNLIIKRVDELKEEIDQIRPLSVEQEGRIFQKFKLEWNYNSNAIEGNKLSLGETKAFLLHGITAKGKPFKDYLDIKGHNEAIDYLVDFVNQKAALTEAIIRELHKILLVERYKVPAINSSGEKTERWIEVGTYKKYPNHVETQTGGIHYYASPEETPAKMGDLMDWYRKNRETLHPITLAASFHYEFVAIHPFDDGNGRMARLLMNLILMEKGLMPVVVRLEEKGDYLLALEKADSGELDDFISLMGEGLIASMELYLKGAKGESLDELKDLDKKLQLLEKRLKADEVFSHPEKDERSLRAIMHNFISPFLDKLVINIAKFDRFFNKSGIRLLAGSVDSWTEFESSEKSLFELFKEEFISSGLQNDWIKLAFDWKGIVNEKDSDLFVDLDILFRLNKFQCEIVFMVNKEKTENLIIRDYYDASFEDIDLDQVVTNIASQIYDKIESSLK